MSEKILVDHAELMKDEIIQGDFGALAVSGKPSFQIVHFSSELFVWLSLDGNQQTEAKPGNLVVKVQCWQQVHRKPDWHHPCELLAGGESEGIELVKKL